MDVMMTVSDTQASGEPKPQLQGQELALDRESRSPNTVESLLRLNSQRMDALLKLNQMTGATLKQITDFALEEAVRLTGSKIGYLAFLNDDESVLTMHAWSKSAMAECAIADKPITYPVVTTGLWGEAVRQRQPVITNDYAASPLRKGCPAGHVAITRHMNIPLFDGARIVLVAGVGNKTEDYDQDDVQQLTLLMEGMWRLIERKRDQERVSGLVDCLLGFGSDTEANINSVTALCGKTMGAVCCLFNRLNGGMLCSVGQWQAPPGFKEVDKPGGHICYDVIVQADDKPIVIRNLQDTAYAKSDPNVAIYGLKTYVGVAVKCRGQAVGSLCVVYQSDVQPSAEQLDFMRFCGFAIAGENERQLAAEELLKMQKLQSIGTLAGGIAHDFNNILMGLFGNVYLAKEELAKDHPGYALLEKVEQSMSRAVRLTQQLLTFSKGGEPVKEDVSLAELIEEVASFDLSGSNIKLVCQKADDLWLANVDKGQIQQVISNLTINARQAMPHGGHLCIALENVDIPAATISGLQRGKYVKLTARDEGVGIAQQHLERIFEPYFTTKQSGSGLGLATAYAIIHKHGGHIGVASELGKGATFTLYLPASESPNQAKDKQPAAECLPTARHARILVMDDEEMICGVVHAMLTRCGFSVATAQGGHEAIRLYKQAMELGKPFAAVIMDLTIPGGIGGKEVIRKIQALDPKVRGIASSGYADDPVMANYADYGFKGVVAKPYTQSKLREVMEQVLK